MTAGAPLTLATLNGMDCARFVARLGGVFEHSPWVAERAFEARPFADVAALHAAMAHAAGSAGREEQLALLRAHPDLAGREAQSGTLTAASELEQKGAGLINLAPEEKALIARLNRDYRARHGFPFIIAVRNYTRARIFSEFERRLANDTETEIHACMAQIEAITRLRLDALVATT
ncbi:MAG: 2-oxo-4-hydroxy-4-carboxy-5-ureidoimidazoline decarboxylase [Betaproteobacteria bacterium]|nr:2-oxo-4-hydroxy-4-carboxy-5-ureidoimidazoline decarboxylase [Betaproteobacteria bacterium]